MSLLKRFVRAIASSKKAVAAVANSAFVLIVPALNKLGGPIGLHITREQVAVVVATGITYIASQALADHGKEAAKVHVAASSVTVKPKVVK